MRDLSDNDRGEGFEKMDISQSRAGKLGNARNLEDADAACRAFGSLIWRRKSLILFGLVLIVGAVFFLVADRTNDPSVMNIATLRDPAAIHFLPNLNGLHNLLHAVSLKAQNGEKPSQFPMKIIKQVLTCDGIQVTDSIPRYSTAFNLIYAI